MRNVTCCSGTLLERGDPEWSAGPCSASTVERLGVRPASRLRLDTACPGDARWPQTWPAPRSPMQTRRALRWQRFCSGMGRRPTDPRVEATVAVLTAPGERRTGVPDAALGAPNPYAERRVLEERSGRPEPRFSRPGSRCSRV